LAAAFATPGYAQFQANGVVVGGDAAAVISGNQLVTVKQSQVVINWTPTDTGGGVTPIDILPVGATLRFDTELDGLSNYVVLNRVIPTVQSRAIQFNGTVESLVSPDSTARQGGAVWFYSPGGIIAGATSRFDVGSLVLTTNDIDTTGGLFGASGEIRFRGAADSRSRVQIDMGAQIDARAELSASNYVALVAPRIIQNGSVTVDGGAAYIAAEQVDMTVPMSGGLFTIQVPVGTSVDNTNETVLSHGGTTTGPSGNSNGVALRRVHMMAVPKNDALTMLVAGTVGYAPASAANLVNGDIVLTTGAGISPGGGAQTPTLPAAVRLVGGDYTSDVSISSDKIDINAATADINFSDDVFAFSPNGFVRMQAEGGRKITVVDDVFLSHSKVDPQTGTALLEVSALSGGSIKADLISLRSQGDGALDTGYGATSGAAGSIAVLADGGGIEVTNLFLNARAFGGSSNVEGNDAGAATGGIVTIAAKGAGGQISADIIDVTVYAEGGDAGYGAINGGFGKAGSISFGASGGASIVANELNLTADAIGGGGQVAGVGTGGTITVDLSASLVTGGSIALSADGQGGIGAESKRGGDGSGGTISFKAAAGSLSFDNVTASADGVGRGGFFSFDLAEQGGVGRGGKATFDLDGTSLLGANAVSINADGVGGGNASKSGAGLGGTASLMVRNGTVLVSDSGLVLNASGTGGEGQVESGIGKGGVVTFLADAGSATVSSIDMTANGTGGNNSLENGTAGDGTGGSVVLASNNGGSLDGGVVTLKAIGTGGEETGYGIVAAGIGTGGTIVVQANAGSIELTGLIGNAIGEGRFGRLSGGTGLGGQVTFEVAGGTVTSSEGIELFAKGLGGDSSGPGGFAKGGQINILAAGGTIDAGNFTGDAGGSGGSAFSFNPGGSGQGGAILISSGPGSSILGLNLFSANGQGGDGDLADAGVGTGGLVQVRVGGGTIDATGGTLTLEANGTGGFGAPVSAFVGGPVLAKGGTVDLEVSDGGQLLLTSMFARANAGYDDDGDGFAFENHGANAVGGTVKLALKSGTILAEANDGPGGDISLEANGSGANSSSGGEGGTGYQGRAELVVSGGAFKAQSLDVIARAFGGAGIDQSGEGERDAGTGGAAGLGTSPYGPGAGAYISVSGGGLAADLVNLIAESTGGDGGDADEFAEVQLPRAGGNAQSAAAVFTVSDSGSVDVASLSMVTTGRGGQGGSVRLDELSGSDAIAGAGGDGTGGVTSLTVGGTGSVRFSFIQAQADGYGGDGGEICTFFCGTTFGGGKGGNGGNGFGNSVTLTFNSGLQPAFAVIEADARGYGGLAGEGPQGGDGGSGLGGIAAITFAAGNHDIFNVKALADGRGSNGAQGLRGVGGRGGLGDGGEASLTIGNGGTVVTRQLRIAAEGFGGRGGDGAGSSTGFSGGAGGAALGGTAALSVLNGSITLLGSGEGQTVEIDASAAGGRGGNGGDSDSGYGATSSGGSGGAATGGEVAVDVSNGAISFLETGLVADAVGGSGGTPGFGQGSFGDEGTADAGKISMSVAQFGLKQASFGLTTLSVEATGSGFQVPTFRPVTIEASGTNVAGAILFGTLDIVSSARSNDNAFSILTVANGSPIKVANNVSIHAGVPVNMLSSDAGIEAGGSFTLTTQGDWFLNGSGYVKAASISATSGLSTINIGTTFLQADDFINLDVGTFATVRALKAGGDIIVDAGGPVSINGFDAGGSVTLRSGTFYSDIKDRGIGISGFNVVAGDLDVGSSGDIELFDNAIVEMSGNASFRSFDDIIIGTGSILRGVSGELPETGYGGPSLDLRAGSESRFQVDTGDIASIIIKGKLETGDRTVQLFGDAVAGSPTSQITAGSFYVNLNPFDGEATPSTDNGQLSGPCIQGAVCLGDIDVTGTLGIGDSFFSFQPHLIQLNGGATNATNVILRASTVRLGSTAVARQIGASEVLILEATDGSLQLNGKLSIVGGSEFARLTSTSNITGPDALVFAPGTVELAAANNITLAEIKAAAVRTIDAEGSSVRENGLVTTGAIKLGSVTVQGDLDLIAGTGVTLGSAGLNSAALLNLSTSAGLASLGGGTAGTVSVSGDSVSVSIEATGAVTADAANGSAALGTIQAASIDADAATFLDFKDLSATGAIDLAASGPISGGSAKGGTISIVTTDQLTADSLTTTVGGLDLDADAGISVANVNAKGAGNLRASSGGVSVSTDAVAAGGLFAQGTSVQLTGANGLTVETATATDGDVILVATGGPLTAGQAMASGNLTISSQGAVTADQVKAGQVANVSGADGVTIGSLQSALASVTATGGDVLVSSVTGTVGATGKSVSLTGDNLSVTKAQATNGDLLLRATSGGLGASGVGAISATGAITFEAISGAVNVSGISNSGTGITASGTAISLTGDTLLIKTATAGSGGLSLKATAGDLTAAQLSATGAATLSALNGAILVSNDIAAGQGITAAAKSISLTGANGLDVVSANASKGDLSLTAVNGGITAGTLVSFGTTNLVASKGAVSVSADLNAVGGAKVLGTAVSLVGANGLNISSAKATAGDLNLKATTGDIFAGTLSASGATALLAADGTISVADLASTKGATAIGKAVTLTGANGLNVASATATGGALTLLASKGGVTFGNLTASGHVKVGAADGITGKSAVAALADFKAGGAIALASLASSGPATLSSSGGGVSVTDVVSASGLTVTGKSVTLGGSAGLQIDQATATDGDLVLASTGDLVAGKLASTGKTALTATDGDVVVTTDIAANGGVTVSGESVKLTALSSLGVLDAVATAGDIELTNFAFALSVGSAKASGAIILDSAGVIAASNLFASDVRARGNSISLSSAGDLNISKAIASEGIALTSGSALKLGEIDGGGILSLNAQSIDFATLMAGNAVDVTATGNITGGALKALRGQITSGGQVAIASVATGGDVTIKGAEGIRLATLASDGNASLFSSKGALTITGDSDVASLNAEARAIDVTADGDLNVDLLFATDGDTRLRSETGTIKARGVGATGSVFLTGAAGVLAERVVADTIELNSSAGAVSVTDNIAAGNVRVRGTSIDLTAQDGLTVDEAVSTGAIMLQAGAGDLVAASILAGGSVTLGADGIVSVASLDAANTGATGSAVNLSSAGDLTVTQATATAGSITLTAGQGVGFSTLEATKDISITAAEDISGGTLKAGGTTRLETAGALTVTNAMSAIDQAKAASIAIAGSTGLTIGTASAASGDLVLKSGGPLTFATLTAAKALSLDAQADIGGGSATGASVAVTTPGAFVADDVIATAGTLVAMANKGVTLDTALSSGTTMLKADQGIVKVASDVKPGEGLIVSAPTISLVGQTGLNIAEANATAGDLVLKTVTGDLIAGKSTATGGISLDSAGALSFASLTAQQGVTLKATGDVAGDSVAGTSVAVTAGGTKGILLQSIAASGPVTLGATAGTIQIGNVLTTAAIQATARSIGLGSTGNILLTQASATDGDLTLNSGGGITLGQVSATKALIAEAPKGTLTVTGIASAATIGFTSADIAIGSGAQVGSVSQTGTVTFTSSAPRTFVGGTGTGTGYRLDASELTRVAARDGFTITALPTQGSAAFTFVEPDQATIVLDSMTFTGAQLGTNGIFTVDAPRSIGIVGNVEYKNFAAGQSVIYRAGTDVSLGAETGLVTLKDSAGALAGTLRLQAPQVTAMSVPARQQVPDLTLNQARQRLGTNDAVQNDGGYFQAGNIDVKIGRLLFIQNSGANGTDVDKTRGFTGNAVRIEATGSTPAQVVVSGRVQTGSGFAVGDELGKNITLVGTFDPASSFGGCELNAAGCGAPPEAVTNMVFAVARDQIQDEEDEDEQEEAIQASQTRPDPVIQFMTPPNSRFDPLIDEPITGAGNEDLWEAPTLPSPGN